LPSKANKNIVNGNDVYYQIYYYLWFSANQSINQSSFNSGVKKTQASDTRAKRPTTVCNYFSTSARISLCAKAECAHEDLMVM